MLQIMIMIYISGYFPNMLGDIWEKEWWNPIQYKKNSCHNLKEFNKILSKLLILHFVIDLLLLIGIIFFY